MKRRVVITGIGVVAPVGIGKENFWKSLKEGKNGIKRISFFDASDFPTQIAGEVRDFKPEKYMDKKRAKRIARFSQFAVACAKMALEDADLDINRLKSKRVGIFLGTSSSAMDMIEKEYRKYIKDGYKKVISYGILSASPSAPSLEIKENLECVEEIITQTSDCRGGIDAVIEGYERIKSGEIDIGICGGVDSCITPLVYSGFLKMGILCTSNDPEKGSRPFDKLRCGGVLSEGGGILIIEEMKHAIYRGAQIYGEILGYGKYFEKKGELPGSGLFFSMKRALEVSGVLFNQIGYISAHAPSDQILDATETQSIKKLFGEYAYRIPVSSIKSMIGNPLSAAGPLQIASSVMVFKESVIPPTINYEFFDEECDLDYVPNKARENLVEKILVNSHSFGGANSTILIGKVE